MISIDYNGLTKEKAKQKLAAGYRERRRYLVGALLSLIVLRTPVDRGEARGGWRVSVGGPVTESDGRLDPSGAATIAEGVGALKGVSPFATIFISNPVKHIVFLENGWSTQAPVGMVKVSLAAFKQIYKDVQ